MELKVVWNNNKWKDWLNHLGLYLEKVMPESKFGFDLGMFLQ